MIIFILTVTFHLQIITRWCISHETTKQVFLSFMWQEKQKILFCVEILFVAHQDLASCFIQGDDEMILCANCGKDLDYHSETQTDRCLKEISRTSETS